MSLEDDDCDRRFPGPAATTPGGSVLPETPSGSVPPETPISRTSTTTPGGSHSLTETCPAGSGPSAAALMDLKSKLMLNVTDPAPSSSHKVTIAGCGMVGMACAFSILAQNVSGEICLIDQNGDKVKGEMMDIQHGSAFLKSAKISADTDFAVSANSKVIIVTAGARQKEGETRLSLLQRNLDIYKNLIPPLCKLSPKAILLIVSNPVDILTYFAWKLSGFPQHRVIGSGTNLDTSRFRFLLSQRLGIAVESCYGWILGEHGDSSVAVWSGVNVAGVQLRDINPSIGTETDPDQWRCVHAEVIRSAYDVIKLKGYTSWAIGLSISDLVSTILRNKNAIHCISINAKGMYDIDTESYLSLPCVLGENGLIAIVKQQLTDDEQSKLRSSAKVMADNTTQFKF